MTEILIVDDEPRMCNSLKVLLTNEGYKAQAAQSGKEALALLNKSKYDLVLLDVYMPEIDGHQVMDHIIKQAPAPPVIVITGRESLDSAIAFLKKGAVDYLKKPFEHDELLKAIEKAIPKKQAPPTAELPSPKISSRFPRWKKIHSPLPGQQAFERFNKLRVLRGMTTIEGKRWLHVSCSHRDKIPSWKEIREVKDVFVGKNRQAIQIFPTQDKYVNIHPFCLHLWCCLDGDGIPDFAKYGKGMI